MEIDNLLDKLKRQAEELDNRYKAMIDICNDIEKVADGIQYDIHKLREEKIMGAFDRTDFALGRYKSAREAYNKLVEEAEYEYGHDGYNGTISTSDGFKMITEHP